MKVSCISENERVEIRLIKNIENIDKKKLTLFCIPFAGGGAAFYRRWVKKMQGLLTVCPVQLPGREERIAEEPYTDMDRMLDDLYAAVTGVVKGPYAVWGHSMGGKIAYELEKRMEKSGNMAQCLFISGSRVPGILESRPIYHLPDEQFKKELERFEGTPKEILENQEWLDFFLPMLRADFTMDETYQDDSGTVLHAPIAAFGGKDDREADARMLCQWKNYTDSHFEQKMFEGGHFYLREHEDEVIQNIIGCLRRIADGI